MQKKLRVEFIPTEQEYKKAEAYADRTEKHTEGFTFQAAQNKRERIVMGCLAQSAVKNFAQMYGLSCIPCTKPDHEPDRFDFDLQGQGPCDVKASYIMRLAPQVHRKNAKIKVYIFCYMRRWDRSSRHCDWIEITGWQKAEIITESKYFVERGQMAPWSEWEQKFGNGSYFYTGPLIIPESLITGELEYIYPDGRGGYQEKPK